MKIILVLVVIAASANALGASDLATNTSLGTATFLEDLTYSTDMGKTGTFGVTYDYLKSTTFDTVTASDITDVTNSLAFDFDWTRKAWLYGFAINLSSTPAENVKSIGPAFDVGYKFDFGEESKDFVPSLTLKETATYTAYVQTFTTSVTTRRQIVRPVTGANSITQSEYETELDLDLLSYLSFSLTYAYFGYSKDVNQFLSFLDSSKGLLLGKGGLSGTIAGFSSQSYSFGISIYPSDAWAANLKETISQSATDGSNSYSSEAKASYVVSDFFKISAGFEKDQSPTPTDNILLADLKFYWK